MFDATAGAFLPVVASFIIRQTALVDTASRSSMHIA
jgi:hypothetical protein